MTLLPEVEHALMTAIREPEPARGARGARGSRGARRSRRLLGPAVTVAMVSLSLAIFVGGLVLLHRGAASGPSGGAAAHRPTAASTRQTLLATLGVLRRPEHGPKIDLSSIPLFGIDPIAPIASRPTRRLAPVAGRPGRHLAPGAVRPTHFLAPVAGPPRRRLTLDRGLTRTVAPPRSPYGVALLAVREGATRSAPATEGLDVILSRLQRGSPAIRLPLYEVGPESVSVLRTRGVAVVPAASSNSGVVVVPDGVARVQIGPRLTRNLPRDGHRLTSAIRVPRQITPVTATVSDNIAGFALGKVAGRTAKGVPVMFGVPVRLQMTWFAANGTVIARPTVPATIWVHLRRPRP
jgi:hypothetical protein